MINRQSGLFLFLIILIVSFPVTAQSSDTEKIPRRIVLISENVPLTVSEIFYSKLADYVPLVAVSENQMFHNRIVMSNKKGDLQLKLFEGDKLVKQKEIPETIYNNPDNLEKALEETAREWSAVLGLVYPEIRKEIIVKKEERKKEISFEEKLRKPWQATLWVPVSLRVIVPVDGNVYTNKYIWQGPVRGDIAWFFNDNIGLNFTFWYEYGRYISMGSYDSQPLETESSIIKPGIGVIFRTIGKLSAEIGFSFYAVFADITALENLNEPDLSAGDSIRVIYPAIGVEPSVLWSPAEHWSLKVKLAELQVNIAGYGESDVIINMLQFGAVYRW